MNFIKENFFIVGSPILACSALITVGVYDMVQNGNPLALTMGVCHSLALAIIHIAFMWQKRQLA